jgi:hypothetical protein
VSTPAIPPAAARAAAGLLDAALLLIAAGTAWYLGAWWMKDQAVAAWSAEAVGQEKRLRLWVSACVQEQLKAEQATRTARMPRQKSAPAADPAEDSP